MSENPFLICVYYYSLPEFPQNCRLVEDNSLLIRDVLVSNPNNNHIYRGGQYDPHYEHELAPQYKVCFKEARRKIMSVVSNGLHDEVYLLFRTNRVSLSGANSQRVVGFYEIDSEKLCIDPDYGEPVVYAKEARFVNLQSSIDLFDYLKRSGNRRFSFSSETKEGRFKCQLEDWVKKLKKEVNYLEEYKRSTQEIEKIFKYYEYEEGIYPVCEGCLELEKCYLPKRIVKKGKLCNQLPEYAAKINDHFKRKFSGKKF